MENSKKKKNRNESSPREIINFYFKITVKNGATKRKKKKKKTYAYAIASYLYSIFQNYRSAIVPNKI